MVSQHSPLGPIPLNRHEKRIARRFGAMPRDQCTFDKIVFVADEESVTGAYNDRIQSVKRVGPVSNPAKDNPKSTTRTRSLAGLQIV